MIFQSHLFTMILYAALVSIVLALIRRNGKRERIRYAVFLFLIMTAGAILFGWFMYLFI
ncbi:MAG: hypothetical protein R6V02_04595 [Candidatus Aminicenantes bacterium]